MLETSINRNTRCGGRDWEHMTWIHFYGNGCAVTASVGCKFKIGEINRLEVVSDIRNDGFSVICLNLVEHGHLQTQVPSI